MVFRGGLRSTGAHITALIAKTPNGRGLDGRVAFVAGKKLGNAVFRNRCKRVLRAAVARRGGPWPGYDVVLISRASTATASAQDLDAQLRRVTSKLEAQR